jgi:hypothetical protein
MHERLQRCVGSRAQRTGVGICMRQAAGGARDAAAEAAPGAQEGIHLRLNRQRLPCFSCAFQDGSWSDVRL